MLTHLTKIIMEYIFSSSSHKWTIIIQSFAKAYKLETAARLGVFVTTNFYEIIKNMSYGLSSSFHWASFSPFMMNHENQEFSSKQKDEMKRKVEKMKSKKLIFVWVSFYSIRSLKKFTFVILDVLFVVVIKNLSIYITNFWQK